MISIGVVSLEIGRPRIRMEAARWERSMLLMLSFRLAISLSFLASDSRRTSFSFNTCVNWASILSKRDENVEDICSNILVTLFPGVASSSDSDSEDAAVACWEALLVTGDFLLRSDFLEPLGGIMELEGGLGGLLVN